MLPPSAPMHRQLSTCHRGGSRFPSQHATNNCGSILLDKTAWSLLSFPCNYTYGLATPYPWSRPTARKILRLPEEAELQLRRMPPTMGNSTKLCTLMQVWGFLNIWRGEKRKKKEINPVILVDYTDSNYTCVMPAVSSVLRVPVLWDSLTASWMKWGCRF